jgi:hypothetical protein
MVASRDQLDWHGIRDVAAFGIVAANSQLLQFARRSQGRMNGFERKKA